MLLSFYVKRSAGKWYTKKPFKGPLQCFCCRLRMLEEQKSQKSMPSLNLSQASLCQDSRYNAETEIHPSLTLFAAIRMQDLVRRSAVGVIPQSQTRLRIECSCIRNYLVTRGKGSCDWTGHVEIRQRENVRSTAYPPCAIHV
jgi:hypothetical protein